jgi:hypothetical protein
MGTLGALARGWRGALGVALLAWTVAIAAQQAEPRESKVEFAWSPDFTPTDVVVAEKETLSIAIEPRVSEGRDAAGVGFRERLAAIGALESFVARIGDGEPFKIGREYKQVVADGGGRLSLRWEAPREYAQLLRGFVATIRVDPEIVPIDPPDNGTDGNVTTDGNVRVDGNVMADGNETAAEPDRNNVQAEILNEAATGSAASEPDEDPAPPEPRERGTGIFGSALPWIAAGAVALLLAAAASVPLRRAQRRRTIERTRSMLSVSPSLDPAQGACLGGSLPAEGPSASLRARLEEGATREVEGGEDG